MPNKHYILGRQFEYRRKKHWEKAGYLVFRTAGSHGFFDLILISPVGRTLLVQCKRTQTLKQAEAMCRKFRAKPPLQSMPNAPTEILEVYVKETRSVESVWV